MELPVFFFDIDGTLLDYIHGLDDISKNTIAALDELRKKHPTFIASGRTKCFIDPKILAYPFDGFVTCNGTYVEYQNKCIYKKAMRKEDMYLAISVAKELNATLYLESRDYIYVVNGDLECHTWFKNKWQMNDKIIVTEFDPEEIEVYIGMILCQDETTCPLAEEKLGDTFDVSRHVNQNSYDLTLKNENKAKGIEAVMAYFNTDCKDAWAFGDGNNDLEMISLVGHGIAMGNAVEPLKQVAFDITDDAVNDGIVTCLKKYGWI